jgi:hypothetical protein
MNSLDRLHLDQNTFSTRTSNFSGSSLFKASISDDDGLLVADAQVAQFQLFGKTPLIDRLEQTRSLVFVHLNPGAPG